MKTRVILMFILLFSLLFQLKAVCYAGRQALVIGNSEYEDSPLQNTVNDAEAMAVALQNVGFTVLKKTDVTQQEMENAIREFGQNLQSGDIALFYFSGHGAQVEGVNYLIPIGARIESERDIKYKAVEAGMVLDQLEHARSRMNIIILDACRDNPFKGFRSNRGGLALMSAPTGTLIAYATAPGTLAYEGPGEHSPYTKNLLETLTKPGLRIEDVFKQVRVAVMVETDYKQVPWESSSLIGDFYFTSGTEAHAQPQTETPATPTATPPTAETSVLIVPGKGVGDLTIGMSAEQVQSIFGQPENVTDLYNNGKTLYFEYHPQGLMVQIESGQVRSIYLYSGIDGGYGENSFQPFTGMTLEGISVNSTEAEVLSIYGDPLNVDVDPENSSLPTKRLYYDGISFKFVKDTGQMIQMWISVRDRGRGK